MIWFINDLILLFWTLDLMLYQTIIFFRDKRSKTFFIYPKEQHWVANKLQEVTGLSTLAAHQRLTSRTASQGFWPIENLNFYPKILPLILKFHKFDIKTSAKFEQFFKQYVFLCITGCMCPSLSSSSDSYIVFLKSCSFLLLFMQHWQTTRSLCTQWKGSLGETVAFPLNTSGNPPFNASFPQQR